MNSFPGPRISSFSCEVLTLISGPPSTAARKQFKSDHLFKEAALLELLQASSTLQPFLGSVLLVSDSKPLLITLVQELRRLTGLSSQILTVAGASDLFLIRQALGIGNLPSIVTTVPLDTRWGTSSTLTFSTRNTTVSQGAGSTIAVLGAQPANAQTELISTDIDEIPCLPGTSYNVTANNTNEAMQVTFMWRERSLEESERA